MPVGRPRKPYEVRLQKTSCHLDPVLQSEIVQTAQVLGISRNQTIIRALRFFLAAQKGEAK